MSHYIWLWLYTCSLHVSSLMTIWDVTPSCFNHMCYCSWLPHWCSYFLGHADSFIATHRRISHSLTHSMLIMTHMTHHVQPPNWCASFHVSDLCFCHILSLAEGSIPQILLNCSGKFLLGIFQFPVNHLNTLNSVHPYTSTHPGQTIEISDPTLLVVPLPVSDLLVSYYPHAVILFHLNHVSQRLNSILLWHWTNWLTQKLQLASPVSNCFLELAHVSTDVGPFLSGHSLVLRCSHGGCSVSKGGDCARTAF